MAKIYCPVSFVSVVSKFFSFVFVVSKFFSFVSVVSKFFDEHVKNKLNHLK